MRNLIASAIAAALCISLSVNAFAATGYATGSARSNDYSPNPTTAQVSATAKTAIQQAISANLDTATISLRNATSLSASTIQNIAKQAKEAKVGATIFADKIEGNSVVTRWYIDPTKATNLTGNLNLEANTDVKSIAQTAGTFTKYFVNDIAVVSLGQNGSYGMAIGLAIKVDLSKLNTSKLTFFSYDKATNTFAVIAAPGYFIDSNGYLHFTTSVGGDIVITDSSLTKK